ncbi:MAG TPA: GIY-YIG nuclease family protein [Steroidobacter sp.]|uniref:GIY-YIG nuclease family protein n=1 Tax=Steroidobacter sp. TaxID=1978227 RepID=UPI002ED9D32B
MTQSWWLYLLACRDGRTYVGIAIDVAARFAVHISGKGAKFTRSNPPTHVLGARAFASKSEALKAEAALKKLNRTQRLAWAKECDPPGPGGVPDGPDRDIRIRTPPAI